MNLSRVICLVLVLAWPSMPAAASSSLPGSGMQAKKAGESTPWASTGPGHAGAGPTAQPPVLLINNGGVEELYTPRGHRLTPPGERGPLRILMAPADGDYPGFSADVAACTGATVDYFNAKTATPSVALLATYDCVLTWVWQPYADNVQMGDNLAAYVDAGGMVVLGQFCLPTASYYLAGAIMGPDYCPVTGTTYYSSPHPVYDGDGTDCVHDGIAAYMSYYIDVVTPRAGAQWDGTFDDPANTPAAVWRSDRRVWYSPGQLAAVWGTGDWAELFGNMFQCRPYADILYAPADNDDPALRADISASCGLSVEYFDARLATPSAARLAEYGLVFTRPYYTYANSVQLGDNLAAYVDGGGRVILGQWCLHTAGNHLEGAIMGPAYCPVTGTTFASGQYSGDGTDCTHEGIDTLQTYYVDVTTPVAGALWDGTFNNNPAIPALIWRADRRVYYSPGNIGLVYSSGQWGELICNIHDCENAPPTLDCDISAAPSSGVLPFTTQFSVLLANEYGGHTRRMAGRIHVLLAGGGYISNWRTGYTNVAPLGAYTASFNVNFPGLGILVGDNTFLLAAMDVTPAPYNQPPYPMSGDTCTDVKVVTGIAP